MTTANVHTSTGAFYFQNSGGEGETRGDPDVLDPDLRENHTDYDEVPVGNEADSYTVFWQKWKTGGIPSFRRLPLVPAGLSPGLRQDVLPQS